VVVDPFTGESYVTTTEWVTQNVSRWRPWKYNADGTENSLWPSGGKVYAGPVDGKNIARAMILVREAVPNQPPENWTPFVYVAGQSDNAAGNADFAMIKYRFDGAAYWADPITNPDGVVRHNGPGNGDNIPAAIVAEDPSDIAAPHVPGVYITGNSYGGATQFDYATLKYHPGSGQLLGTVRYSRPGVNGHDVPVAVRVTGGGTESGMAHPLYVFGHSYGGPTTLFDYMLVKYDADTLGEVGTVTYDDARNETAVGMVLRGTTVYVTGSSERTDSIQLSSDYLTVAYSGISLGLVWKDRYPDVGTGVHCPTAIAGPAAAGQTANVVVTGSIWRNTGNEDWATRALSGSGAASWTTIFKGPGLANDRPLSVAMDVDQNAYVAGWATAYATDYAVMRYTASTGQAFTGWPVYYLSPNVYNLNDAARSLAVRDVVGVRREVFVTGVSPGASTGDDDATLKILTPYP
jgi:hypothetical protein